MWPAVLPCEDAIATAVRAVVAVRIGQARPRIDTAPIAQYVVPRIVVLQGGRVAAIGNAILDAVGPVQIRARPERVGRRAGRIGKGK